jgi:nucleotide-binding universal stress UspA family protein
MFKRILVPVELDYPDTAALVYQRAADYADLSGAEIRLVTVMPGFSMPIVASVVPEDVRKQAYQRVKDAIETFVADHCDPGTTYSLRTGKNWEEIIRAADEWQADLVIVYHNRQREFNEVFSKSCSQRVSDNAKCSVLRLRNLRSPS